MTPFKYLFVAALTLALFGCARPPSEPFAVDLMHAQQALDEGFIEFDVNREWATWDAQNIADVDALRIASPLGTCTGVAPVTRLEYKVHQAPEAIVVRFQPGDVECRFSPTEVAVPFNLYPLYSPRALFDPGEMTGQASFVVRFKAIVG